MRFVLDHDVPLSPVRRLFTDRGHECWRAPDHLGSDGKDDEISVYAHDKNAVVVSHDAEFMARRIERTFGIHVRLRCEQAEAKEVLGLHIDDLLELLETVTEAVFEVSRSGIRQHPSHPI